MKKKTLLITIGIFVLLVVIPICNLLFIWGICFEHAGGFNLSYKSRVFEDVFPEIHDSFINLKGQENQYGIPFVIMFGFLDSPPYAIKFSLRDKKQTLRKLIIDTVEIRYDQGECVQKKVAYIGEFSHESLSGLGEDGKLRRCPVMWLDGKLDSIVDQSKSCTVKMKGYFVNAAEEKIPFDSSTYFEYEPVYWRVYTGSGIHIIND